METSLVRRVMGPRCGLDRARFSHQRHGGSLRGFNPGCFRRPKAAQCGLCDPESDPALNETRAFRGGNFWDGKGHRETLAIPPAEQAKGPFLNPVEQALRMRRRW